MSPPNLSADAPVLNILQPLCVNFFPMLRKETNQMLLDDRERFFGFRITQKPLLAQPWLDRHFAAIAESAVVFVGLGFGDEVSIFQKLGRSSARFQADPSIES